MTLHTYRVGFQGAVIYLNLFVVFLIGGLAIYYFGMAREEPPPLDFMVNFVRIPWLICLGILLFLFLVRLSKSCRLRISSHQAELTEYFLIVRIKRISINLATESDFRMEIPCAPRRGSPCLIFQSPKRIRIGKGLALENLQEIYDRLKSAHGLPSMEAAMTCI